MLKEFLLKEIEDIKNSIDKNNEVISTLRKANAGLEQILQEREENFKSYMDDTYKVNILSAYKAHNLYCDTGISFTLKNGKTVISLPELRGINLSFVVENGELLKIESERTI